MSPAVRSTTAVASAPAWGRLPGQLRALFVTSEQRTGAWLAEALAHDRSTAIELHEAVGISAALSALRDETFDAVLVSHAPDDLDALTLVEGLRGGGGDYACLILGAQSEQELGPLAFEIGADAYLCVHTTTTRMLVWQLGRAVERHRLIREHHRLVQAEQQRLRSEHDEAQRLLDQQRALVRDLESIQSGVPAPLEPAQLDVDEALDLPEALVLHYRELLRTYVIMGSGNLGDEMLSLADLLSSVNLTSRQAMQLHVHVLSELVRGLGTRSARHVMSRADLLVLEVMMHLSESYRRRWWDRMHPPRQQMLPGFEDESAEASAQA